MQQIQELKEKRKALFRITELQFSFKSHFIYSLVHFYLDNSIMKLHDIKFTVLLYFGHRSSLVKIDACGMHRAQTSKNIPLD